MTTNLNDSFVKKVLANTPNDRTVLTDQYGNPYPSKAVQISTSTAKEAVDDTPPAEMKPWEQHLRAGLSDKAEEYVDNIQNFPMPDGDKLAMAFRILRQHAPDYYEAHKDVDPKSRQK